jgi:hypothetical protein
MKTPDIKQNPHPKQRYEITVTVAGAGPVESVEGAMQYRVENEECVPVSDPVNGVRIPPKAHPPIEFKRVSDGVFRGTLYTDLMQDEDYYGLGVCKWAMTGAVPVVTIDGVPLSPAMFPADIHSQQPVTRYFTKDQHPQGNPEEFSDPGAPFSEYIEKNKDKFFSITLIARKDLQ